MMLAIAASPRSCRLKSIVYHAINHVVDIDPLLARVAALPLSIQNVLIYATPGQQLFPNSPLSQRIQRWFLESPRFRSELNLHLYFLVHTEWLTEINNLNVLLLDRPRSQSNGRDSVGKWLDVGPGLPFRSDVDTFGPPMFGSAMGLEIARGKKDAKIRKCKLSSCKELLFNHRYVVYYLYDFPCILFFLRRQIFIMMRYFSFMMRVYSFCDKRWKVKELGLGHDMPHWTIYFMMRKYFHFWTTSWWCDFLLWCENISIFVPKVDDASFIFFIMMRNFFYFSLWCEKIFYYDAKFFLFFIMMRKNFAVMSMLMYIVYKVQQWLRRWHVISWSPHYFDWWCPAHIINSTKIRIMNSVLQKVD